MPRKSNFKRRGIPVGVQRGAVRAKFDRMRVKPSKLSRVIAHYMEKLVTLAFGMVIRTSSALHLIPFSQTSEGLYEVKSKNGIYAYQAYKFITALVMVYRGVVTFKLFFQDEFSTVTMLAVIEGLAYFDAWIVTFYDASDTVTLLNNLKPMLSYLEEERGREFRMFAELRLSFKILYTINMIPLCILTIAVANGMLFGGLPTSFVRMADGLIEMSSMDRIWWQLLFLPWECLFVFSPLMTSVVVNFCSFTSMHISKVFGEEIRSIKVVDMASREKVERMYLCWQLTEKMARPWLKPHLTCLIMSLGCAAVIHIVVAVKYTNLPMLLYSVETVMAPGFVFMLGVLLYDAVMVSQLSQGVLGEQLGAYTGPLFGSMALERRREMMKRTKAMRPITISVGSFTEVQYAVMVAIWEEILNQVIFLLTL